MNAECFPIGKPETRTYPIRSLCKSGRILRNEETLCKFKQNLLNVLQKLGNKRWKSSEANLENVYENLMPNLRDIGWKNARSLCSFIYFVYVGVSKKFVLFTERFRPVVYSVINHQIYPEEIYFHLVFFLFHLQSIVYLYALWAFFSYILCDGWNSWQGKFLYSDFP